MRAIMKRFCFATLLLLMCASFGMGQQVQVQEVVLNNGMRLLMAPRKGDPNIAAGWIARVGSVNERPGITGLSHLFEHMMFKGTHTIGTKNYVEDTKIMDEMDSVRLQIQAGQEAVTKKERRGNERYDQL